MTTAIQRVIDRNVLYPARSACFALLDAARDPRGPSMARAAGLRTESLYDGWLGDLAAGAAPYLAAAGPERLFQTWLDGAWTRGAAILGLTHSSFDDMRRHFRRFLMVKDEAGKRYRFRFYDPRVFRAFLPACTADELVHIFGPVERFYAPSREGDGVLSFALRDGRLQVTQLAGAA